MKEIRRKLINTLKEKQMTLVIAESITCGLAAHRLSAIPGISEVLAGSIVCYSPEMKMSLLKVPGKIIEKHTCESAQVTKSLAENLHKVMKADLYAAATGLASPGGSETKEKPVGTVFLSVCYKSKTYNQRFLFRGTPNKIKVKACDAMYEMVIKIVNSK